MNQAAAEKPPLPSFRLDGRQALVTGAGRGIGAACARALADAGAHVTLVARSADEIAAVAGQIADDGGQARHVALDLTDSVALGAVIDAMPGLDILVNNAGMNRPAPFLDVTRTDYDAIVAINLTAAFFCAQAAARRMVAAGKGGVIINMSSQMGVVGGRNRSVYCATKYAIEGLTKAMALDLADQGVRVNTVCPTYIETPMTRPFLQDPAFKADVMGRIPLGRLGQVGDIAGAVVFLAGDAAALMTGASLVVDGGWTAQ